MRDTIREHGPQPFGWFMQQALYHAELGYYSSGRATIGRKGDYFTNVSVGPVFGNLLAAQFVELWERLDRSDDFTIVEQGAHDGHFARDVLSAIRVRAPQLSDVIHYRIVEPFSVLKERQQRTLQNFRDNVCWSNWLVDLEAFTGVHFSNELLDAMPVNLRCKSVGLDGDQFVFVDRDDGDSAANQSQLDWMEDLSTKLRRGLVIAVDYGFVRSEFHEVVQARSRHRLLPTVFEEIGNADISIHINWTDIAERAEKLGFRIAGFTDQHHFLTGLISLETPANASPARTDWGQSPLSSKQKRELQTLLHPEMLGRAYQAFGLAKGIDLSEPLAGFRFARDARTALELKS